jgi:hypothetical protein
MGSRVASCLVDTNILRSLHTAIRRLVCEDGYRNWHTRTRNQSLSDKFAAVFFANMGEGGRARHLHRILLVSSHGSGFGRIIQMSLGQLVACIIFISISTRAGRATSGLKLTIRSATIRLFSSMLVTISFTDSLSISDALASTVLLALPSEFLTTQLRVSNVTSISPREIFWVPYTEQVSHSQVTNTMQTMLIMIDYIFLAYH